MSNAKEICTTLLSSIEQALASIDRSQNSGLKNAFRKHLRGALELQQSPEYLTHGYPPKTIANSARSALIACSESSATLKDLIWSPMIAALFTVVDSVVNMQEDLLSNRVQNISIGSASSQASIASEKINIKKSNSLELTDSVRYAIKSDMLNGNKPVFRNLRHVACKRPRCEFCIDLWQALVPTRCVDTKCHVTGKLCHSSSWYVHVYPTMWTHVKRAHDAGEKFTSLSDYIPHKNREPKKSSPHAERPPSPTYAAIANMRKRVLDGVEMFDPKSPRMEICEDARSEDIDKDSWAYACAIPNEIDVSLVPLPTEGTQE